jgi:hypothetical protein
VNGPFLMGVLNSIADLLEELKAFPDVQAAGIAVPGYGFAGHVLHSEIGPSILGSASIEDLGNVRMAHESEGLALRLEARNDSGRIQITPDELEGDSTADGFFLFGLIDLSHSSGIDLADDSIGPDEPPLYGCGRYLEGLSKQIAVTSAANQRADFLQQ